MMRAVRTIGTLCLVLAAACAEVKQAPPSVVAQTGPVDPSPAGPNRGSTVAVAPPRSESIAEAVPLVSPSAEARQPVMTGNKVAGIEPGVTAPAPPSKSPSAAKVTPPLAKAHAKPPASPVTVEQPRKIEEPPPAVKKLEPPLDVAALKTRLRDTNAIGMFTKLALKNQVDDLLKQFKAHYLSGRNTSVSALRQPYDMLVLKVLTMVQDGDPSLARTILGSREAIWGILSDPEKFNSVI